MIVVLKQSDYWKDSMNGTKQRMISFETKKPPQKGGFLMWKVGDTKLDI